MYNSLLVGAISLLHQSLQINMAMMGGKTNETSKDVLFWR